MDTEPDGHRVAFNEAFKQKGAAAPQSLQPAAFSALDTIANALEACIGLYSFETSCFMAMHACAGINHEWDLELYGRLLETGGGKERMTAYFTVSVPPSRASSLPHRSKCSCNGMQSPSELCGWGNTLDM